MMRIAGIRVDRQVQRVRRATGRAGHWLPDQRRPRENLEGAHSSQRTAARHPGRAPVSSSELVHALGVGGVHWHC